jgi:hypothetical protein
MTIFFANQNPSFDQPSIFLAGPTPRTPEVASWRPEALRIIDQLGFTGSVLVPERHDWTTSFDYISQVEWEFACLENATVIAFWIPRDLRTLPGFTTNVEFGRHVGRSKCIYGRPPDAPKNRYLDWLYTKLTGRDPGESLEAVMRDSVQHVFQS